MTDYREITALMKQPAKARELADYLLGLEDTAWTEWELSFLDTLIGRDEELTTRQGEKLVELRDAAVRVATIDGFLLRSIAHACWFARYDLNREDDIAFIERIRAADSLTLRRRDGRRLIGCARALGLVEAPAPVRHELETAA